MKVWYTELCKKCMPTFFLSLRFLCIFVLGTIKNSYASYVPVANTPGTTVWEIMDALQGLDAANNVITQASLPLVITVPGVYAVAQDLTLTGVNKITISCDDVIIDLKGHILTVTSPATAITIGGSRVIVCNGSLSAESNNVSLVNILLSQDQVFFKDISFYGTALTPQVIGINALSGATNVFVQNCDFDFLINGIFLNVNSAQIFIYRCHFAECSTNAIAFGLGSSSISIKDIDIELGGTGILISGGSSDIIIEDAVLSNVGTTSLNAAIIASGNFLILNNISIMATGRHPGPVADLHGITLSGVSGAIIKNCAINGVSGDGIHFGPGSVINTVITGCTVDHCAQTGVNLASAPLSSTNHVYNTLSSNNGVADFTGVPLVLIAMSDPAASVAPYWMNIGY